MPDSETWWLTVTNLVLGAVVLSCVVFILLWTLSETRAKQKRMRSRERELNHDMHEMFAACAPAPPFAAANRPFLHGIVAALTRLWRRTP